MASHAKQADVLPELYVGIVARMGTNTPHIVTSLKSEASKYGYMTVHLKVTDIVKALPKYKKPKNAYIESRYRNLINTCNDLRSRTGSNAVLAYLITVGIKKQRKKYQTAAAKADSANGYGVRGIIYIIDQLKKPEEVTALRSAYGDSFIALSCHAPYQTRLDYLSNKITADHGASEDDSNWLSEAADLIKLDEAEDFPHGQDVRSAFPLADYILDASSPGSATRNMTRLFHLLFDNPSLSPTYPEYGNNLAAQAAYRSTDLSRQVGAAIFDDKRRVLALGCNEVPKAGGGTYWEDSDEDGRDQNLGYDENTLRKQELLLDVIMRLQTEGHLSSKLKSKSYDDLKKVFLDKNSSVKDSKVLDITEFGRPLHAEMNAITDASRGNGSTQDADLFVTTFPCHNCAKHIVGAGIKSVFYLEPYPKSQASELYPDSIIVDPHKSYSGVIPFQQFCGVTKRRFHYFSKNKLKDSHGKVHPWTEASADCVLDLRPNDYRRTEAKIISEIGSLKHKKALLGEQFASLPA